MLGAVLARMGADGLAFGAAEDRRRECRWPLNILVTLVWLLGNWGNNNKQRCLREQQTAGPEGLAWQLSRRKMGSKQAQVMRLLAVGERIRDSSPDPRSGRH